MGFSIPDLTLPVKPPSWGSQTDYLKLDWQSIPPLAPFMLHDNSRPAHQQTITRVCCSYEALYVRFDCDDDDIWGTLTGRDAHIYDEEVVEIFLGAGAANPTHYYEFEVSPNGVLLDLAVRNPTSDRINIELHFGWDCAGIVWQAERHDDENHWSAVLVIPWDSVKPPGPLPAAWRANFYRIERPRNREPEYSCWSPTMAEPADFHKPAYFGIIRIPEKVLMGA